MTCLIFKPQHQKSITQLVARSGNNCTNTIMKHNREDI